MVRSTVLRRGSQALNTMPLVAVCGTSATPPTSDSRKPITPVHGFRRARILLFLNNDTIVTPGWLSEMVGIARSDRSVGIVGIKQLFPYTNTIYHTGIVFAPGGKPEHLYPHLDASLPKVNKQREYQAVTGACLLSSGLCSTIAGGSTRSIVNGYEDIDLCMQVRQRRRKVVCCTSAYIYHYGQISEGRTADDDKNAALFLNRWSKHVKADRDEYLIRDRADDDARHGQVALESGAWRTTASIWPTIWGRAAR